MNDNLLGYFSDQVLFVTFCCEVAVIILMLAWLFIERMCYARAEEERDTQKLEIERLLTLGIQKQISTDNLSQALKPFSPKLLLGKLEQFSRQFNDEEWKNLRYALAADLLLPKARRWANSFFWSKRCFAARCFACGCDTRDKSKLEALLQDSHFLVSYNAAIALLRQGKQEHLPQIINQMSTRYGYARALFQELLEGYLSSENVQSIQNKALGAIDEEVLLVCLQLLSVKLAPVADLLWERGLQSSNDVIRLAATHLLGHNPQKSGAQALLHLLDDSNDTIRAEACQGLAFYQLDEVEQGLRRALKDSCWKVKLQAANSLKKLGPRGTAILRSYDRGANQKVFELSQYVFNMSI